MKDHIPLEHMTTAEKLEALEAIWEDLRRHPEEVPAPSWHADVLQAREQRIQQGISVFEDWDDAKRRIRDHA